MAAIASFNKQLTQLVGFDAAEMTLTEHVSTDIYNTELMCYSDLGYPTMENYRRLLERKMEDKISHNDLLEWLKTEQTVENLLV